MREERMTVRTRKRLAGGAALPSLGLLLSGCSQNRIAQDTLNPAGPYSRKIDSLFWPVFWIAVAVFFLVEGLLVFSLYRFRHREGRGVPKQVHGNKRLEITWTIIPAVLLLGVAVPTIGTIFSLSRKPPGRPLQITVVGHQWWWEVKYPQQKFTTANEIHIPAGQPVYVAVTSIDVIHSFWVPRLAGKQDLEPNRVNHLTIQADRPGVYLGQCAEFCGASHANMRLRVFAEDQSHWQAWLADMEKPAPQPPPAVLSIMQAKGCGGCHTIDGVQGFAADIGPNLTHFGNRSTFAGATFRNNVQNLTNWLKNPPGVKPGADMPDLHLTPDQIQTLIAYLEANQ
jgi:cytochrome c oxidase subunit 2